MGARIRLALALLALLLSLLVLVPSPESPALDRGHRRDRMGILAGAGYISAPILRTVLGDVAGFDS